MERAWGLFVGGSRSYCERREESRISDWADMEKVARA